MTTDIEREPINYRVKENGKPVYCTVHTRKSLMETYVLMYIMSVGIFLTAFIIDLFISSGRFIYQILMIVGAVGTLIATIIWGIDRQCIPEYSSTENK